MKALGMKVLLLLASGALQAGCATSVGVQSDNSGNRGTISTSIPF